jgi:hypothetical protein
MNNTNYIDIAIKNKDSNIKYKVCTKSTIDLIVRNNSYRTIEPKVRVINYAKRVEMM